MRYLVDTHAFLWAVMSPERLTDRVRGVFTDREAELLVSIATPWEMAIKCALGKLDAAFVLDNFESLAKQGGYTLLDTAARHVISSGRLFAHHRDPFDRLLAAQALDLRIPLISRDRVFDRYGVKRIWD